jgi:hypothetical protein
MRVPHVQFKIGHFMIVVAVAALVVTPFAWAPPELRGSLLIFALTVATMLLIVASPFLIDRLEGGRTRLAPRTTKSRPLPWPLSLCLWADPPHKKETPRR